MPSESIAGFLDQAKANRVLIPEQVEQLIRQPDVPQSNLAALCEYLEARGAITRYQADALRTGRGHDLSFAGYPVLDELGPCPGGTAYRALHPSLRTPLELRRYRADALLPLDNPVALVHRARTFPAPHPNLVLPLDAGVYGDQPYAEVFERVFATPSGVDVAGVAHAHGLPVRRVATAAELGDALQAPIDGTEVIVATIDRSARRTLNEAINALV